MRDKLISLLKSPHKAEQLRKMGVAIGNYEDDCIESMIADYLLANGVIVPPCKVGDTVYKISRNKVKKCEVVFIGISADEKCSYFNFIENYEDGTFYKSYSMVFDVIGKTVFLSREDAEAALDERR